MRKLPRCRLAFAAALAGLVACGAPSEVSFDPQPAGTTPQSIKASSNQRATSDPSRSATTFSTATTTLGKGTAVVGYSSKPFGAPTAAWSFSPDAGATWSDHRSDEEGEFKWPTPPVSNDSFTRYGDAPTMIALDAFPGVVAAVVSVYGTSAAAIDVVVLISTDGGAHFKNPVLIDTEGWEPEPGVHPALDYVTAGPLLGPGEGAGATVWTLFRDHDEWRTHKHTYDPISESMKTKEIYSDYVELRLDDNHNKIPTGPASILASFDAMGVETVYIAWSNYDNRFDACPSLSPQSPTVDVRWRLSYSPWEGGTGFFDYWKAIDLGEDASWPRCIGDGKMFSKNSLRPALAIDPVSNTLWAAHNRSAANGSTKIVVSRVTTPPFGAVEGGVLSSTMTDNGDALPGVHDQWGPTLAVLHAAGDSLPTVAVTWHDTRDDPASPGVKTSLWGGFSHSETQDPNEPIVFSVGRITPLTLGPQAVPWTPTDFWGRYDGIAASPATGDFLVAWGDNRAGGRTQLWTSRIAP